MNIDKIRQAAKSAALEVIHSGSVISAEGISEAISKAVAAAFEEYEKQDD